MQLEHAHKYGDIGENGEYYKGGEFLPFYKPRPLMPQVSDKAYPQLIAWCARNGLTVSCGSVSLACLKPHQRIDKAKAQAIPPQVLDIPLLVSCDGYILDGNHRYLAHKLQGKATVRVIQLGAAFDEAIADLFRFLNETQGAALDKELSLPR